MGGEGASAHVGTTEGLDQTCRLSVGAAARPAGIAVPRRPEMAGHAPPPP